MRLSTSWSSWSSWGISGSSRMSLFCWLGVSLAREWTVVMRCPSTTCSSRKGGGGAGAAAGAGTAGDGAGEGAFPPAEKTPRSRQ